jgi:nitric oxide reductase large subunit
MTGRIVTDSLELEIMSPKVGGIIGTGYRYYWY